MLRWWATLILVCCPVEALDPGKAISQYMLDSWSVGESPALNRIYALAQTQDGYLWLGTRGGLVRFDGVQFTVIPGLENCATPGLLADRGGVLWIASQSCGLYRLEHGRLTRVNLPSTLSGLILQSIARDHRGRLWIGTYGNGLLRDRQGQIERLPLGQALDSSYIMSICEDRQGAVWLGDESGGVSRWLDGHMVEYPLAKDRVEAITEDRGGELWIGTYGGGLWRLRGRRFERAGLEGRHVSALLQDRQGTMWVGTEDRGLYREIGNRFELLAEGLASSEIHALLEDQEGNLWIATDAGLSRLKDGKFTTYTHREGLLKDRALCVMEDRTGAVWMGTDGGGLSRLERGRLTTLTNKDGLVSDWVLSLLEDRSGVIQIGTWTGISRWRGGQLSRSVSGVVFRDDHVYGLAQDRQGDLWAATDRGLLRTHEGTLTQFPLRDAYAIAEDPRGDLWFGSNSCGLHRFSGGQWREIHTGKFTALHADSSGAIWAGTPSGLLRVKDDLITEFLNTKGLPSGLVGQILEDAFGFLWLGTDKGIWRVRKRDLDEVAAGKRVVVESIVYGRSDGLRSIECSHESQPACWRGRDGRLWFTTTRGVSVIDPARIEINRQPPPVLIEKVLVDGQLVDSRSRVEMSAGRGQLEIHYTGLSLTAPERVGFAYRLEGFDHGWIDAAARRTAYYTNIPPGRYRFVVKAHNNDGIWNETGAAIDFEFAPLFYATWWFYTLCAGGVFVLGEAGYRFRVRRVRAAEQRLNGRLLQAQDEERRRLARELHDGTSQGLTALTMNLRCAMNSGAEDRDALLAESLELAKQCTGEIRTLAYLLHPPLLDEVGLAVALRGYVRGFSQRSGIAVQLEVPPNLGRLSGLYEITLFRIVQEALVNVHRHAGSPSATVRLALEAGGIELEIADNGVGFAPATEPGVGLSGMRERIQNLKGSLEIRSGDKGTTVRAVVPWEKSNRANQNPDRG
jgi:ligand-binding sensor domain-containing protein/signal transduction histidine kinase